MAKQTNKNISNESENDISLTNMQIFGKRLKLIRTERELSQKDLGDALGKGQTIIAYWEKGEREIKMTDLIEIADFLNVSPTYLMGYDDVTVHSDGKTARFSKKDFEILSILQQDKKFMKEISDNPQETIQKMLKVWESIQSVIGEEGTKN
ncbi:helix-turn-helix domain-containing protein [Virgibacillus sp. 6R]|uniref:helix-turn-helix domain-containing protein n=1 Tax=Metabacillus niabensis TaxID=324854 RepID=UPI001642815E